MSGPFDIVMMDMTCTKLLKSVTECGAGEAQRFVFMGWPGQNELEAAASGSNNGIVSRVASEGDLLSFDIRNRAATAATVATAASATMPPPADASVEVVGRAVAGGLPMPAEGRPTKAVEQLLDEPHSRQLG